MNHSNLIKINELDDQINTLNDEIIKNAIGELVGGYNKNKTYKNDFKRRIKNTRKNETSHRYKLTKKYFKLKKLKKTKKYIV